MKKTKKIIFLIIIITLISSITFVIGRQIGLNTDTSSTSTTIEEKTVGTQTIKKTLTSSGEIQTANTEKFRKQNPDMNEKINQWLAFIDDYDREMVKVAEEKNEKLKKARIEMNYLTGEAETRRLAELREKWEMDRVSAINHATRKGIEERKKRKIYRNS